MSEVLSQMSTENISEMKNWRFSFNSPNLVPRQHFSYTVQGTYYHMQRIPRGLSWVSSRVIPSPDNTSN